MNATTTHPEPNSNKQVLDQVFEFHRLTKAKILLLPTVFYLFFFFLIH